MPAATAFLIDAPSAEASGIETIRPAGFWFDGRVDELAHRHHVEGFGRAVIDLHLHVLAGRLDAVLHHRPERIVGLAVADHDDAAVGWACAGGAAARPSAAAAASPVTNDFITFLPDRALSEHRARDDQAESRMRLCRAIEGCRRIVMSRLRSRPARLVVPVNEFLRHGHAPSTSNTSHKQNELNLLFA